MSRKFAYYNEIDAYAAQWLRNLINAGHIAPGFVDERSIEEVFPDDLREFTQCHFFAGIGVWSYALRRAGWPDDRPVWTGSCPCQPFSSAGKGSGFSDERHLWPAFFHLIQEHRPAIVLGEQVASKDANPWIDLVQDDLEGLGYGVGAVPFPAASVGAPHIRDRLYWVADTVSKRVRACGRVQDAGTPRGLQDSIWERERVWTDAGQRSTVLGVASPQLDGGGREAQASDHLRPQTDGPPDQHGGHSGALGGLAHDDEYGCSPVPLGQRDDTQHHLESCSQLGDLGDTHSTRSQVCECAPVPGARRGNEGRAAEQPSCAPSGVADTPCGRRGEGRLHASEGSGANGVRPQSQPGTDHSLGATGPTNGLWRDADWLLCRDGKWRPVEPGTFPLAHGAPARVGRLRAYGNAICAEAARTFIEAVMEIQE